jgi:L-lactate dehydrogenase complex protein LldG
VTPEERDRVRAHLKAAVAQALLPRHQVRPGPDPRGARDADAAGRVAAFTTALEALGGRVHRARDAADATRVILDLAARAGALHVACWDDDHIGVPGVAGALRDAGIQVVPAAVPGSPDERARAIRRVSECDMGITGAAWGCADTGSLVLAHGPGRPRLTSLLAPRHLAVLRVGRLAASLSDAMAQDETLMTAASNVVVVTGPSRTADIEMTLTRGVHGPKEVEVILF